MAGLDAVIVFVSPSRNRPTADALAEEAARNGVPLIDDTDDAFHMMDETHPEFEQYAP